MKRIRRFLCIGLMLSLILGCLWHSATAAEEQIAYAVEGGNLYFDPNTGTVSNCDHSVTSADIPKEINGIAVTAIGKFAFDYCENLRSVSFPEGLETIGQLAFGYCYGLTAISLPDSLTTLEDKAFFDCTNLENISLGNGLLRVGRDVFWGAAYLRREKNWENDLLYAGNVLLAGRDTLAGSLILPEKTRVIAGSAFYGRTGLTEVIFPEGLVSIGPESFYYCIALENLQIPDSVLLIEDAAFAYAAALQELKIGNAVQRIGQKAFTFCGELQSATLGQSVAEIGSYAFAECDALRELRFRGNAPAIGEHPFDYYNYSAGGYTPIQRLTLYYPETAAGWTCPLWQGYPTATWKPPVVFSDVIPGSWYAASVDFVVSEGLMNGMSATSFAPDAPMTRAMLVTVLWRYAGQPEEGINGFRDVADNVWYTQAVAWAAEKGIVTGVGNNCFNPDGKITREQLAVILYRYCNSIGIDTGAKAELSGFPDAQKISPYAVDALSWTVEVGLVTGSASGGKVYLEPQGNATRAQVATILMRFIEKTAE